jgi:soluble lytic murein transglycosylase-like protein
MAVFLFALLLAPKTEPAWLRAVDSLLERSLLPSQTASVPLTAHPPPVSSPHPALARILREEGVPKSLLGVGWVERRSPHPALARILRHYGVPESLLWVGWVESRFQPAAVSPKGAAGWWQLMPATARAYGLEVGRVDERLHVEKSTRVAARFLRDLYASLGDWKLALAAYNAGPARVHLAIERGRSRDFDRLSSLGLLPAETRAFVPAVEAAARRPLAGAGPVSAPARVERHRALVGLAP